ncbi:hypothetical protein [Streptomyces sp. NPDC056291]|uniref:hypothetical protein n=1 Tax=Streptomyces sp. NPDC056291 TaxID=3345772 RepID=UPI0035E042C2
MAQVTDLRAARREDITAEHKRQAARVLAIVAKRYEEDEPSALADGLGFVTRVGAAAYDVTGRALAGAHRIVAAVAREAAPEVEGTTRGELAAGLLEAARAMGWSEHDNAPAIPRHPVPGPRETSESGRVPAPRPEQFAGVAR